MPRPHEPVVRGGEVLNPGCGRLGKGGYLSPPPARGGQVDVHVDALLDKPDRAVAHGKVGAAGVVAAEANVVEVGRAVVDRRIDRGRHVLAGPAAAEVSADPAAVAVDRRLAHRPLAAEERVRGAVADLDELDAVQVRGSKRHRPQLRVCAVATDTGDGVSRGTGGESGIGAHYGVVMRGKVAVP